jgi:dTMP kinase
MKRGLLITFEGPDGSGKSTQISMLKEYLSSRGFEVVFTREPGGTKISENIRDMVLDNKNSEMSAMCEALLYAAARAQHVGEVIRPAIEDGQIVICDRFVESSIVYQGIGRNLGIDRVRMINDAATEGLKPDITFMLTIPYEEGLRRKAKQKTFDRLENSGDDFHRRVFEGYMQLANSAEYIRVIDAHKDVIEVHSAIIREIEAIINK